MRRLLVANRGEIAVRIVRACRDLGVESVVAHSAADRGSLAVELADRAVCIGPAPARDSYLQVPAVIAAALGTGCDAVHPGYGFLAEDAAFAAACTAAGLTFVGPTAETISLLGDKIAARQMAAEIGVPVVPGSPDGVRDPAAARRLADELGYPVLVKPGGGGGGKGLRRVDDAAALERALGLASAEAGASSGNDAVYLERFVTRARHIEIQIAVDEHGTARHFGERDCSVQRHYQKLVEETPSPAVDDELRRRLTEAATALVRHVGYRGVGTVEFLLDEERGEFAFIEVNTRLQVEHPVTELVTGRDLVALQLRLASGELLDATEDAAPRGHAIEFRINAEDPADGFRPSAGRLTAWRLAAGPWVRTDSHCFEGYVVPPYYDSLLGKVVVSAPTRELAIARSVRALAECRVEGVATTLPFHRWLLDQGDFAAGAVHTGWVQEQWARGAAFA